VTTILDPNNRLFVLVREGKHQPSALTAIAVVFGALVLALIPGQMLARLVIPLIFHGGIQSTAGTIVQNITGFLPVYLGLWFWLRWSSKRPFWTLGLERQHAIWRALRGALVAGLMMAATAGLATIPGASLAPGKLQTAGLPVGLGIGLLSLLAFLVQGSAEEVLFRGWLLPVIGSRYRPWIGVLVSALIFSVAHAASPGITVLGFLNLFLFGVFASVYALAEGGVWGICAWHAVWNWVMGDLLGFALDGTPHLGLMVSMRATGPDVISGGAFGLEGGLASTAVFLIAIGTIAMLTRPEKNLRNGPDEDERGP
jgi:membrane protease YdiL (CAAX protease family)